MSERVQVHRNGLGFCIGLATGAGSSAYQFGGPLLVIAVAMLLGAVVPWVLSRQKREGER